MRLKVDVSCIKTFNSRARMKTGMCRKWFVFSKVAFSREMQEKLATLLSHCILYEEVHMFMNFRPSGLSISHESSTIVQSISNEIREQKLQFYVDMIWYIQYGKINQSFHVRHAAIININKYVGKI